MKTMIAVPCMDTVYTEFARSLLDMYKPEGTKVCFRKNSLIYDSRNLLCITAIENGFDRILWLDSDMVVPPDTLSKLSETMDAGGYDLVTGLYFKRYTPTMPVLYKRLEEPTTERGRMIPHVEEMTEIPSVPLFRIAGCGFGCVLTRVDLIKRMWEAYGPVFSPYVWAGEDVSFCHRANLDGANMVCDARVKCGHIGTVTFTEDFYRRGAKHEA